jgi:N-acetylneuraminate synthase
MNDLLENLYIFEMANNHQGSVEHGLRIIDAAARIARTHKIKAAVKLQFRELDSFVHDDFKERNDLPHIPRFMSTKLDKDDFRKFTDAIKSAGMVPVATPFDEASVGTCLDLGIQVIKVASCSATDWPLLTAIADARKPVIASTGGLEIVDIDNLVSFFRKRVPAFALMHCVSVYPTPDDQIAMGFMGKMIKRYPYIGVGYSGHEAPDNTEVAVAAVSKGARLLERHFGVPTDDIKLNDYSMNPEQAERWVAATKRAAAISGENGSKHISQAEMDSLQSLRRGVYATRAIKKGDAISDADVFFAMPCQDGQLSSGEFGQVRANITASQDYPAGAYGLEQFRQTGCIIVNLINREYCEKLLIVLPSQSHPMHAHKKKEETFRVLWGDLEIDLNGNRLQLEAGDKLLVERGAMHGFSSVGGAIVQEVSTTHIIGDSYYKDPKVRDLDPMQRKTIIKSW